MAVNLEPVFGSIDDYPAIIEAAVHTACTQAHCSRVVLVGHSMGGIAIRAWMRSYGSTRVAGVVTLGSPHQGTRMARRAWSPNAQQMAWRSGWLKALAASESDAVRALFRIAITAQDNIVFPQRVQVLPGIQATVFEGIGHLQMCLARPVIDWVAAQVQHINQQEVKP
jgi:pimeloyl-ACP methyl ester carboxylesterase